MRGMFINAHKLLLIECYVNEHKLLLLLAAVFRIRIRIQGVFWIRIRGLNDIILLYSDFPTLFLSFN